MLFERMVLRGGRPPVVDRQVLLRRREGTAAGVGEVVGEGKTTRSVPLESETAVVEGEEGDPSLWELL